MLKKNFTRLVLLIISSCGLIIGNLQAQTPWSGEYGNEWLVQGQKYARIPVKVKGIHQVNIADLPADFVKSFDPEYLQLWHRGKQVALLQADATKIVFYGETNDGKYDELLYRPHANLPGITSRMNTYVSLFSDDGVYFLVVGNSKGLRSVSINSDAIANPPIVPESFHMRHDTTLFKTEFSYSNSYFIYPNYMNSFYEYSKTLTDVARVFGSTVSEKTIQLTGYNSAVSSIKPKLKFLIHSRSNQAKNITVKMGKTNTALRLITTLSVGPFNAAEYEFDLDTSLDIDATGKEC
ncbi:hypothetical protein [Dyadobacter sp. NIV53]|uniref:hypothetical protein n=1 Tax=Dyadobacter sp. NIV53 TaxID=2861765 RepID=UPI001C878C52|nr:hypothetical protein [Dyadobacter sp. NIV53]